MAGTLFGFPFDEELFSYRWNNAPDPVTAAIVDSGVMVEDPEIAAMISAGSNVYTVPFYNVLGGTPQNYDGKTDITAEETGGGVQSGVVWGRAKAWTSRDFIEDFNRADPMGSIASQVGRYWDKYTQTQILAILKGIFGMTSSEHAANADSTFMTAWLKHTYNIASTTSGTVAEGNKIGPDTVAQATVAACGDKAQGQFGLAIMHSVVACNLAGTNLLQYRKYTDPMGIERALPIVDINGMTVIVDDSVPTATGAKSSMTEYTSYVLARGCLRHAPAPVKVPVEGAREPYKNGGMDTLITRKRETIIPNGISYVMESGDGVSPSDTDLADPGKYMPVFDPKCLGFAQIVSNG